MKLEELALCTREEFEQELNKMCPDSKCKNPGDDLDGMNRVCLEKALSIEQTELEYPRWSVYNTPAGTSA